MTNAKQTRPNRAGPAALRRVLTEVADFHLDDARLALVASAEAAGEDVEHLYPAELWHIEQCVSCAYQYGELVADLQAAFQEIADDAATVPPAAVYAAWLLARSGLAGRLRELVEALVARLPIFFSSRPVTAADVSRTVVERATRLAAADTRQPLPDPAFVAAILKAIRADVSALSLYLAGVAQSIWGRRMAVQHSATPGWSSLQITPLSTSGAAVREEPVVYTLAEIPPTDAGEVWRIAEQELADPSSIRLEVLARRLSPLSCFLAVRVEQGDRPPLANYRVQIRYGEMEWEVLTDPAGLSVFSPLPIAALAQITMTARAPTA